LKPAFQIRIPADRCILSDGEIRPRSVKWNRTLPLSVNSGNWTFLGGELGSALLLMETTGGHEATLACDLQAARSGVGRGQAAQGA